MCCGGSSRSLSRLSITVGLLSLITLLAAVLTNSWLYIREPVSLPAGSPGVTTITFRIGLWRVCPNLKRVTTSPSTLLPSPGCQLIKYSDWREVKEIDLGVFWSSLEFTPSFITKMRYAMPMVVLAVSLMSLATLFAMVGHCKSDLKTLVACGLYTLGGLTLACGLVVFVSVLSDEYTERRHLEYRYGWSFHAAGTAFVLSEIAALVSITAYLRRFASVEEMVRAMVPGADRKLRHHQLRKEYSRTRKERPDPETESSLPTPPDICTNKPSLPEGSPESRSSVVGPLELQRSPVLRSPELRNSIMTPANHRPQGLPKLPSKNKDIPIPQIPPSHPATLVLPEHEPFRYTTIIHQGLLGVAEGTSSSGSSASSGGTCSSHSLPRTRLPAHIRNPYPHHAHTLSRSFAHAPDCKRGGSPSSGTHGYYSAVT